MGIKERATAWAVGELRHRIRNAAFSRIRHRAKFEVRKHADNWVENRRELYRDWEEKDHAHSTDETC